MNIIISAITYYPDKNGVQYVTQYQAEELVKRGHSVTVITKLVKGLPNIDEHNGVKIIRIDMKNKFTLHFGDKRGFIKTIIKSCRDANVLIAVCLQSASADWLLNNLEEIKCTKILYMHGMHEFKWSKLDCESFKSMFIKIIRNVRWGIFYRYNLKKIRGFDGSIHLHKEDNSYKYFQKHNLETRYVIENCASDEFFISEKKYKEYKYAVCIANYDQRKNQEKIIEAFYKSQTQEYGLILIGSSKNKYYEYLKMIKEKLDKTYGKKDVKLLTDIHRKDVADYVKKASFYIMASKWEAFPISIIEAMAAQVPFISTDVGIVKLLPGGVIVTNEDEMVQEIENFINDEKYMKKIGEEGWRYAKENLSQIIAVDKLEDILLK